uniref:Putative secreted protein n=1 Tax=Ixodes ricinus TaxID=34613 RepID=A0A6B0USU4_IXORI
MRSLTSLLYWLLFDSTVSLREFTCCRRSLNSSLDTELSRTALSSLLSSSAVSLSMDDDTFRLRSTEDGGAAAAAAAAEAAAGGSFDNGLRGTAVDSSLVGQVEVLCTDGGDFCRRPLAVVSFSGLILTSLFSKGG